MDLNTKFTEIKVFLDDIFNYLKIQSQSFEYQNAPQIKIDETETFELLERCENLLKLFYNINNNSNNNSLSLNNSNSSDSSNYIQFELGLTARNNDNDHEETSYLDMSVKRQPTPSEYVDVHSPIFINNHNNNNNNNNNNDNKLEINNTSNNNDYENCNKSRNNDDNNETNDTYDICVIRREINNKIKTMNNNKIDDNECPYFGLPVAHLYNIKKSPKYGQLIRIEKRFIFAQTKKLYCGIINGWLLCYNDNLISIKPLLCIKLNNMQLVEQYRLSKKRNLYFQLINKHDNNKRYVFQTETEFDTKNWIEIIKKSINEDIDDDDDDERVNDTNINNISINNNNKKKKFNANNLRKLPTPPVHNKMYATNNNSNNSNNNDIYEEPCIFYYSCNNK